MLIPNFIKKSSTIFIFLSLSILVSSCFLGKRVANFKEIKSQLTTAELITPFVDIQCLDLDYTFFKDTISNNFVKRSIIEKTIDLLDAKYNITENPQNIELDTNTIIVIDNLFEELNNEKKTISNISLPTLLKNKIGEINEQYVILIFYDGFYKTDELEKNEQLESLAMSLSIGMLSYGMYAIINPESSNKHIIFNTVNSPYVNNMSTMRILLYDTVIDEIVYYISNRGTKPINDNAIKTHILKCFNALYYK